MRIAIFNPCCLILFAALGTQSLSDVAREEAERRRLLDEQKIEAKVIEGDAAQWAPNGHVTQGIPSAVKPSRENTGKPSPKSNANARSYRSALQKLDKAIREEERRLELKQKRLEKSRWVLPKVGPLTSSRSRTTDSREKLQDEIEEIQGKITQLRQERMERYEEGKRAGFLPGELEGK